MKRPSAILDSDEDTPRPRLAGGMVFVAFCFMAGLVVAAMLP